MSELFSSIDASTPAITQWKAYSEDTKAQWRTYLGLKPLHDHWLDPFPQYHHAYGYTMTDEAVGRAIFCAALEIIRYNQEHGMRRAFLGNSGGLDSATTCALLSKAAKLSEDTGTPFTTFSYGLPIQSNPTHDDRAKEAAMVFGVPHITIDKLDDVFRTFKEVLDPIADRFAFSEEERRRSLGNVKARMRMMVNFFGTTQPSSYVVSTDNLSELYMAFWTLMGDVGAFGPIQHVLKGLELPAIAYSLGVPKRTLMAKPTDGLGVHPSLDQEEGGDTDAFHGVRYPDLDAIICHATTEGLKLHIPTVVRVDATRIRSTHATQEVVDRLVAQMANASSVWKRTKGSIGSGIDRDRLGLPSLVNVAARL